MTYVCNKYGLTFEEEKISEYCDKLKLYFEKINSYNSKFVYAIYYIEDYQEFKKNSASKHDDTPGIEILKTFNTDECWTFLKAYEMLSYRLSVLFAYKFLKIRNISKDFIDKEDNDLLYDLYEQLMVSANHKEKSNQLIKKLRKK